MWKFVSKYQLNEMAQQYLNYKKLQQNSKNSLRLYKIKYHCHKDWDIESERENYRRKERNKSAVNAK